MPADLATTVAQTTERLRDFNAALLDGYQREPRSMRRGISRDLARANPIAPRPPRYGAVSRRVTAGHPLPIRLSHRNHEASLAGVEQVMVTGDRVPVSGRARRDVKRLQRAEFWFRFKIAADDRADAQVLADLNARMLALPWDTSTLDARLEA